MTRGQRGKSLTLLLYSLQPEARAWKAHSTQHVLPLMISPRSSVPPTMIPYRDMGSLYENVAQIDKVYGFSELWVLAWGLEVYCATPHAQRRQKQKLLNRRLVFMR